MPEAARAVPGSAPDPTAWTLAALRAWEVSSRELLAAYLAQVAARNPGVNAVVTVDASAAEAAARAADDLAAGRDAVLGALHGVPFTVKDAIETAGMRSTSGAIELADYVPAADAPAVARLRRAGGVLFGKTNCPAWCGDFQTHNRLFGVTSNPWDATLTAGGSSGGSAAAVAAGMTAFDLGTDIECLFVSRGFGWSGCRQGS